MLKLISLNDGEENVTVLEEFSLISSRHPERRSKKGGKE